MSSGPLPLATALPSGPAYTVVLLCHVAAVLVAMVTMVAGAAFALRLLSARDGPLPPSVRSYFSPGANWAGRVLYLVPVLGAVLLALSGGAYRLGSAWVLTGIGLWLVAIAVAELVLWPAEQRVRRALTATAASDGAALTPASDGAAPTSDAAAPTPASDAGPAGVPPEARRGARVVCASSALVLGLLVVGSVVMTAKP